MTIVGIVADVHVRGARGKDVVETYIPYWHNPEAGTNVLLKTAGDPAALAEPLRRAVKDVDPGIAVASVETMDAIVAQSIGGSRFYATLVGGFSGFGPVVGGAGGFGGVLLAVPPRHQG